MPDVPPDIADVQLTSAWLDRVDVERNLGFGGDFENVSYVVDFSSDVERVTSAGGTVLLNISVLWTHAEQGEPPFTRLSVRIGGTFAWTGERPDESYVSGWLKFFGTYLLWPFARAHIATLTALTGLPALQIMTVHVPTPSLGHSTSEFGAVEAGREPSL